MLTCDSTTCPGGCCSQGACVGGTANAACGSGGASCVVCQAGQICESKTCTQKVRASISYWYHPTGCQDVKCELSREMTAAKWTQLSDDYPWCTVTNTVPGSAAVVGEYLISCPCDTICCAHPVYTMGSACSWNPP